MVCAVGQAALGLAGPGSGVQWLVPDGKMACVCSSGVACETQHELQLPEVEGVTSCSVADALRCCAICCTDDTHDEDGTKNEILICEGCSIPVHVFCYGQVRACA